MWLLGETSPFTASHTVWGYLLLGIIVGEGQVVWEREEEGRQPQLDKWVFIEIPSCEHVQLPTVQATHLDDLSDFLVPPSESQGIFAHQWHSAQPFFPSVKNKAHKSRPHTLGDRSVMSLSPDNVQIQL